MTHDALAWHLRRGYTQICSLVGSFNNHGSITSTYRFIGEESTIMSSETTWGGLVDHAGKPVTLEAGAEEGSGGPIGGSDDAEFVAAVWSHQAAATSGARQQHQGERGLTSVTACLPVMRIIEQLQRSIESRPKLASRL
eukprot:SAG25_NODE_2441_length_1603_cov_1.371676_4_plen_139_part_00